MAITNNSTAEKRCPRCGTRRDPSWFSSDISRPDFLACWCKPCARSAWRQREWGITQEEFDRIIAAQGGGCGICGGNLLAEISSTVAFATIRVDRDAAGNVRGFLCPNCRTGLKGFDGNVDRLRSATEYVSQGGSVGRLILLR
jgi:hypothetical protein